MQVKSPVSESLLYVVPAFRFANSSECRRYYCVFYTGFLVALTSDCYILDVTKALRGVEQKGKYSLRHFLCPEVASMERMTWRWFAGSVPHHRTLWFIRYWSSHGEMVPELLVFTWGDGPCVTCLRMGQWPLRYLSLQEAVIPEFLRYLPSHGAAVLECLRCLPSLTPSYNLRLCS
jgi:hypothetical protein